MKSFDPSAVGGPSGDGASAATGYKHAIYAASLAEFGKPRALPRSGGWLLERSIPGYAGRDAMGCYPLFACDDWSELHRDLDNIGTSLVSLVLVADPLGNHNLQDLERCFPEHLIPFKQHFLVDLAAPARSFVDTHHQRNARKALRDLTIATVDDASTLREDWSRLYSTLIDRHGICGIAAFSAISFERQLEVPGLTAFAARLDDEVVGITLWYRQGSCAYYHLGAYSGRGYELRASFGLFWHAIDHFARTGLRMLDLGAGAGLSSEGDDGLSRFKRGWSNASRTAYLCGRIFDRDAYNALAQARGQADSAYFPAYRAGEFG